MDKKKAKENIEALAKAAGKTPFDLLYKALGDVLAKTPVDDLQRIGVVSGEPEDGKTDREESAMLASEVFGNSVRKQIAEGLLRAVAISYDFILQERLYLGLGASFRFNNAVRPSELRKMVIQMKLILRRYEKFARSGDDPEHPYYWHAEIPQCVASMETERIRRHILTMSSSLKPISSAEVKAFESELKTEIAAIKKRAKGRASAFDWLTPELYESLCREVLDNRKHVLDRLTIKPLSLVTRKDIVSLLSQLYLMITELDVEMNGPHDKYLPKSYFREKIQEIKKRIKQFPKDIQEDAKREIEV